MLLIVDGKIAKSPQNLKVNTGTIYEQKSTFQLWALSHVGPTYYSFCIFSRENMTRNQSLFVLWFTISLFIVHFRAQDILSVQSIKPTSEMISSQKRMTSLPWMSIPAVKQGFGVVYCAYSKDTNTSLPKYFEEALKSATRLKENNPDIKTAIITNADKAKVPTIFDKIVHVSSQMLFVGESNREDGVFRQWFSRIYYLAHSPFAISWYVDSHAVFATTQLRHAFQQFQESNIDFAVSSSSPTDFQCHNFAMLYRWNDQVKAMFVDWILEQLKAGINKDDQATLCRALKNGKENYGLKYGALSPNWAFAWLSLNKEKGGNGEDWFAYRSTRVITGKPQVCHSPEAQLCDAPVSFSKKSSLPHIYYHHTKDALPSVFYSENDINNVLPYEYPSYDWKEEASKCDKRVVCTV